MNKFEPLIISGQILGWQKVLPNGIMFFSVGRPRNDHSFLPHTFPQFQFRHLKQVHGNEIILSSEVKKSADGHWSDQKNHALVIETADCLPILLYNGAKVIAVHAGWRGVAGGIINGLQSFLVSSPSQWVVAIGPHIQKESFEIGNDVADQLDQPLDLEMTIAKSFRKSHPNPTKCYYDLVSKVKSQLQNLGVQPNQIFELPMNTFTETKLSSFRRDGDRCGRNLSFVALT